MNWILKDTILKTGRITTAVGRIRWYALSFLLLLFILLSQPAQGRELTDMNGRKVTIPDTISKVVGVSPPATYLLYAIDPTLIGGANTSADDKKFMVESFTKLPVIGGFFGQSKTLNQEILLQIKPDFVVYGAWRENATMQYFK